MKALFSLLLFFLAGTPVMAQKALHYAIWVDGLVNPQLAKSSLYLLGVGVRGEVSKPGRNATGALFAQAGYGHFFQKSTSAFTATIGLANVGYRYQSKKAFTASVGVGVQFWSERMRIRFADNTVDETFNNVIPGATAGVGFRFSRYTLGLENRVLLKPETGLFVLRNNSVLSIGYSL